MKTMISNLRMCDRQQLHKIFSDKKIKNSFKNIKQLSGMYVGGQQGGE